MSRRRRKVVEQKEVDILIAVDMLTHTFRRNMHQVASFLTSDLDFRPLIEAIVREGMYIHLWYPEGKTNKELIYAADSRKPLTAQDVFSWCTKTFKEQYNHQLPIVSS